jgi:hypothetical protein
VAVAVHVDQDGNRNSSVARASEDSSVAGDRDLALAMVHVWRISRVKEEAMMKLPGFTAENSLYIARESYAVATAFDGPNTSASVQPAVRRLCDVLAELVWGAYNEGAYNRAEFWGNVMEGAGCFN